MYISKSTEYHIVYFLGKYYYVISAQIQKCDSVVTILFTGFPAVLWVDVH